jgi:ankyrin repeat protein
LGYADVESKIRARGEDLAVLLLVAAACGFEELLEKVLRARCRPDKICAPCRPWFFKESDTALFWAVERGDIKTATLLLEKGAKCNKTRTWNDPPLTRACRSGNTDMVALLLKHGVNENKIGWKDTPALVAAMPFPSIVDMLLERGADCQVTFGSDKFTPIECAIRSGNVAMVQRLLDHGVPLEICEAVTGRTMPTSAAVGGAPMLQFLHPYGVIPVPSDRDAQYAMPAAVRRGDSLTTEYFLNRGFDPNSDLGKVREYSFYDLNIRSYLGSAAEARDPVATGATLDVLLHYGADIDKLEELPCCWSRHLSHKKTRLVSLRLLLERGANSLPEHKFGLSMLTEAAERNRKEAIQLLLTHAEKRALTLDDLQVI